MRLREDYILALDICIGNNITSVKICILELFGGTCYASAAWKCMKCMKYAPCSQDTKVRIKICPPIYYPLTSINNPPQTHTYTDTYLIQLPNKWDRK